MHIIKIGEKLFLHLVTADILKIILVVFSLLRTCILLK